MLANYQMDFVAAPPNVNEPIGFDVLPDGRVVQTDRRGGVRLHDPATNTTHLLAQIPVYMASEDGMYGPAVDNDFATNKWVYLYYSPLTHGAAVPGDHADGQRAEHRRRPERLGPVAGLLPAQPVQVRRRADARRWTWPPSRRSSRCRSTAAPAATSPATSTSTRSNNLWMVTGDDTPAGGGNSGGFSPHNDMLTATGLFNAPHVDARRSALNTNDLRGKILRIKVQPDGSYTIPRGNLFTGAEEGGGKTRPEIYAMGFRNPFRITLDDDDVAYITDYSPDSQTPTVFRGPAGTGRMMVVRKPANYGWPLCYSPDLPYYRWNFNTSTPLDNPPQAHECNNPTRGPENTSRWNTGLTYSPPIAEPELWYSYQDNNPTTPLGTPCAAYYTAEPAGHLPAAVPRARHRRRRAARRGQVRLRPAQPEPDEVPRVLRRRDLLRRVHPRLPAGDPAGLGRRRLQDQ